MSNIPNVFCDFCGERVIEFVDDGKTIKSMLGALEKIGRDGEGVQ